MRKARLIAIGAILALGALSLFVFPLIGLSLHLSNRAYGLWAGPGVDNTAEATKRRRILRRFFWVPDPRELRLGRTA
jgi:uncharacterized membrane protein YadS